MFPQRKFRVLRYEFELNIVPILDCLTILVMFILASGVYVSMGMLDISVSKVKTEESGAVSSAPAPGSLTLRLAQDRSIQINRSGQEEKFIRIPPKAEDWNLEELKQTLKALKQRDPDVKTLSVEPEAEVVFQDVVTVMEVSRVSYPDVILGGF